MRLSIPQAAWLTFGLSALWALLVVADALPAPVLYLLGTGLSAFTGLYSIPKVFSLGDWPEE